MPIYEYECNRCQKITETLQKFSDPPLSECPHCRGNLHKLMSLNSFHLKGSGWYVTDYSGKNAGNRSVQDSNKESINEEKTTTSENSDSKTKSSSESGTE